MKERKYKEDWVNETRLDENTGKEIRVPVYRGPVFQRVKGQGMRSMLLWAFLPWLFFVALILLYFRLFFPGSTVLYVFLPAALSLFPALYWGMGIWTLLRDGSRSRQEKRSGMTRLEKENGAGRVLRSSAGCMICTAASLIGDFVYLCVSGQASREWPGTVMILAALAFALGTMNHFRTVNRELESGKTVQEQDALS